MQKLSGRRKTDTPMDVQSLLVRSSVDLSLNKEETLSEQVLSTLDNNPEGVQVQHTGRSLKAFVYVLSKEGKPLMPCSYAKSKRMVKSCKAKVVKRFPFTIQLEFECENKVQDITLGIDSGYQNIGFSCVTKSKELISGTVTLDSKTRKRLDEKRMYRRNRRNRLWYRKPRFLNRKRKEGWLPPSVERRYQTHLNLINKLKKIIPISEIVMEAAKFDIQKIMNPEISGIEYQQGTMYEYRNRISYLIAREKGICQYCNKEYNKGEPWRLHHIYGREQDKPEDWALLHKNCHEKLHKNHEEYLLRDKKTKSYKDSTFMNIVRKRFKQDLDCNFTYGHITFQNRIDLNLEKSHVNDAFVIANGNTHNRCYERKIEQKRRHNRSIQLNRKGFKPSTRTSVYKIQPKDLITVNRKEFSVIGIQNKGTYVKVKDYPKLISTKKIEKVYNFGSFAWNTIHPHI